MNICLGIGSCTVHSEWERKSISTERTFPDIWKPSELFQKCHKLCYSLTEEVEESNIKGKTVTLKLKTSAFEVKQRSMTFPNPISSFADIHKAARILLETEMKNNSQLKLRLMGVRLSSLEGTSKSPSKKRSSSAASTLSLDRFFSPEEKAESSTMESKRVKMSEEVQRNSEDGFETKMSEEVEGSLEDGFETSSIEMKTCLQCPICNKDVPGDNAALNLHVDECLNQSAIEEMSIDPADVSICSSIGNKSFEMLQQPSTGKTTSKSASPLSRSVKKKSQKTGQQNSKGSSSKKGKAAVSTPVKSLKSFFV
ncbi:PREDICTED: DNA polymerase kappa-like [Amphimedon queenslandica]|uniref:DNA-directed DNA polymerase n=2 Tax=Amphimedon queenslandica TaxID=400682 RepID=A0AAN0IJ27_AMPQE|nr:PREDICTED: DNA polymerase kappa-like [Amphimedon queenslandica]|eukprot:XP_003391458.2 PREDICTED: DNA polymerase kappa-like [Amphimedon queenslandica]